MIPSPTTPVPFPHFKLTTLINSTMVITPDFVSAGKTRYFPRNGSYHSTMLQLAFCAKQYIIDLPAT